MNNYPLMEEDARRYVNEIRSIPGVVACALVSCEGVVLCKYSREGSLSSPLFAAMCATVLASAEAACGSVRIQRPSMVTIAASDSAILIVSAEEAALIAAVIDKSADLSTVQRQLSDIAIRIGGVA
ncbi:MAG: roadblock/LC7 domain-containing protein [Methanoculleus sp.]|uniref:roadblock/LC7 domain-containing protein n=2 Tax=Methanoculleus TaxID=45989 RepID=UPI00261DDC08|nr:roadblock/LC7 domain-containing protein [Methanoculleus sp.]MCK9318717.1 roadblock/LC7 domain-containing protein [Methanoculleus sp.]MDD3217273.1 roadblock/LC7 domain-containing protein [Methanoculleus sp.]MDD4471359.1 roadblock/LC7 domain-containing protein [Methanoculleus sp.]